MEQRYTPEERTRLERNKERLVALAASCTGQEQGSICLELERFVIDPASGRQVPLRGKPGLASLFNLCIDPDLSAAPLGGQICGHAFVGAIQLVLGTQVPIRLELGPGAQFKQLVGPATNVCDLLAALEAFDERVRAACDVLGVEWQQVALGVNPVALDPSEQMLIKTPENVLLDAYLSKKGRYAKDMMRLSASTTALLTMPAEADFAKTYQVAAALGPIVSFLCDNVNSWRGLAAGDTPRMVRSRIWAHTDPDRVCVVPGTFSADFSVETYVDWLLERRAIFMTCDDGTVVGTSSATVRDIMALQELSDAELLHLMRTVFPNARLTGALELRDADAMPPRLAAAYAAFIKGIFMSPETLEAAHKLLAQDRKPADVDQAYLALRNNGWDATIYGKPLSTIVNALIQLAENGLSDPCERLVFHTLSSIWQAHLVPRSLYDQKSFKVARA